MLLYSVIHLAGAAKQPPENKKQVEHVCGVEVSGGDAAGMFRTQIQGTNQASFFYLTEKTPEGGVNGSVTGPPPPAAEYGFQHEALDFFWEMLSDRAILSGSPGGVSRLAGWVGGVPPRGVKKKYGTNGLNGHGRAPESKKAL